MAGTNLNGLILPYSAVKCSPAQKHRLKSIKTTVQNSDCSKTSYYYAMVHHYGVTFTQSHLFLFKWNARSL